MSQANWSPTVSTGGKPIRIEPGMRIRVSQQIPQRDDAWTTRVEGEVISFGPAKTGSWFAHGKDDKLWLDRVEIRKADGEITICNLDQYSRVEILDSKEDALAEQ